MTSLKQTQPKQKEHRWCSVLRCYRTFPLGRKATQKKKDDKLHPLLRSRRMKPRQQINKYVSAFTCACFHPCPLSQWPERVRGR